MMNRVPSAHLFFSRFFLFKPDEEELRMDLNGTFLLEETK